MPHRYHANDHRQRRGGGDSYYPSDDSYDNSHRKAPHNAPHNPHNQHPRYKGRRFDPDYQSRKHGNRNGRHESREPDFGRPVTGYPPRAPRVDSYVPRNEPYPPRNDNYKGRNFDPNYHANKKSHHRHNSRHRDHYPQADIPVMEPVAFDFGPFSPQSPMQPYPPQPVDKHQQLWAFVHDEITKMEVVDASGDTHMCTCADNGTGECQGLVMQYKRRLESFSRLQHDIGKFVLFLAAKQGATKAWAEEFVRANHGTPLLQILESAFNGSMAAQFGEMGMGGDGFAEIVMDHHHGIF